MGTDYQKWVSKLLGFNFTIKYKSDTTNTAADALSRHPALGQLFLGTFLTSSHIPWDDLVTEIQQDPLLHKIHTDLAQGSHTHPGFHLIDGLLYHKNHRVLSRHSVHIAELLHEYHDSALGGHSGEFKSLQRIATDWYW